jgi:hypothetical protein
VSPSKNKLYYGDNLDVLQRYVKDETVDLVYLDKKAPRSRPEAVTNLTLPLFPREN